MADEKKPPAETIRAYDRQGQKITIPKDEIGKLYALGGRIAKKDEVAAGLEEQARAEADARLQESYAKRSTTDKIVGTALMGGAALSPTLAAWQQGGRAGLTAGLEEVAAAKLAETVSPGAGKAMRDQAVDLKEAYPTAHGAGEVAGMVGGALASGGAGAGAAGAAAKALPGVGIGALGGMAEAGAARLTAGLAAKGVLGRAAATGINLGTRGAVEGGLYAGTQAAADQILADPDLSAQKLFTADGLGSIGKATGIGAVTGLAGGAALGGAGSLAASGARRALGGLSRVMSKGEQAAVDVSAAERTAMLPPETSAVSAAGDAPAVMGTLEREVGAALDKAATKGPGALQAMSNEAAFRALQSTSSKVEKVVGLDRAERAAVGDWVNREIFAADKGAGEIWRSGKADGLRDAIQAARDGRVLQRLSDATAAAPARVKVEELAGLADGIHKSMAADPVRAAGADAFLRRVEMEATALSKSGRIGADGTMDAVDAYRLRGALERQAYELGTTSGDAAKQAYKEYLRGWDDITVRAIDDAATKAGKAGAREEILAAKREYQLASKALRLAEDGARRVGGNNAIGLRVGLGALGALAHGNIVGAAGMLGAGKVIQDRGYALAAYAANRLADSQAVAKWVSKVDDQIARASKGLLEGPAKGVPKAADRMPPTRALSRTALAKVAEFNADPESFLDRVSAQHEMLATHSPEIAEALTAKHVQAMTFLASKVPVSPDPDPFDPHPAPKLTPGEQAELGRYWWYAEKPSRFYAEVARGKITWEGAETAQALTPGAFEELQMQVAEQLTDRLAKGDKIPFRQRQILGVLLDFAATPSQRPEHARFLQKNIDIPIEPPPPPAPKRAAPNPSQRASLYDQLEAKGPGGR